MAYARCPRCGLAVRIRAAGLAVEHCPRCIAKARLSVPMSVVGDPADQPPSGDGPTKRINPALPEVEAVAGLVVRATQSSDAVVVALAGELDLASVGLLAAHLAQAAEAGRRVVIDLSDLDFLDSTGLQLMVATRERLRARGQDLCLRAGPPAVQRVFELTQTEELFSFEARDDIRANRGVRRS